MKRLTYWCDDGQGGGEWRVNVNGGEANGPHVDRLAAIEDILGDEYDLERLRALVEADRMIGQEVWAQEKYLKIFREKSSFIQRTTIQYVSLLKGKDILCHTQTCAFPLNEIGKTVFSTRTEAEAALRREQDEQIKP